MTDNHLNTRADSLFNSDHRGPSHSTLALVEGTGQTPEEFRRYAKERFPDLDLDGTKQEQWRGMVALEILHREGLNIPMIRDGAAPQAPSTQLELTKKVKELARSNRELEQFASVASHDLQEPLRMISTYTQLLVEQYRGRLDEIADRYIHYIIDGATRMQDLIRDLLELSRSGRPETGLRSTDSADEAKLAVSALQAAIQETGAVITIGPLPIVMAHASQLRQVFQNLLGNAIKFHDGHPPAIQVSAAKRGTEWIFSVTDNGISIAPEHAQRIFDIFQRLHTREEYPGNGIGLAICKKIVEQHGGMIWVDPRASEGAVFNFTWPSGTVEG
jgi:light-regulated signal transduction histidine kinase (bacteriophytochrome)